MTNFFLPFTSGAIQFSWRDVVDIIIVAAIIYSLMRITTGTRALQVLKGLGIILAIAFICSILNLPTVTWILSWLINAAAVLLVILFQPEIRRALEKLGGGKLFGVLVASREDSDRIVEELLHAIINMSKRKVGALIVFERKTGLNDIIETGTVIDAEIVSELIENIFYPNTPLHDGAIIIREGKIAAAGCFLPLSDNKQISSELGTRHRAALGVSEVSDSYTIVVSEETGVISHMYDGVITRYLDIAALRDILDRIFIKADNSDKRPPVFKFRRKVGAK